MAISRLQLPKYARVREAIWERIASGEFPPGSQVPTEDRFLEQYGVEAISQMVLLL